MHTKILQILLTFLSLIPCAAHAQGVGRVLLAAGEVTAVRGTTTVKLTPGAAVQEKDVLRTGASSNLQVRFADDSMVSLRENSELRIDEFRFNGKEDGTERAFFNLVKGGLRAFTGLVGRSNNDNYRMNTNTATIGIRGTDYVLALCEQGSCRNTDGGAAKDGLYGRPQGPSHGTNRVDVRNEREQKQFGINDTFYVADRKSTIDTLIAPPDFLSGKLEGRSRSTAVADAAGGSSGTNGTQQDSRIAPVSPTATGLAFVAPETAAGGTAPYSPLVLTPLVVAAPTIGLVAAYSSNGPSFISEGGGAFVTSSMLILNGTGDLIGLNIPAGTLTTSGNTLGITGSASLSPVDTGVGSSVNAHWGRWPSGSIADGSVTSSLPGGAHYLYGDLAPPDVVASKTGTFLLSFVGGTTPTDSTGGLLSSGGFPSITLNFTAKTGIVSAFNMSFTSGLNFNFSSSSTGTIAIVSGQGATFSATGTQAGFGCTGGACISGVTASYQLNGVFLGAQGNHLGVSLGMQAVGGAASAQGVKLYTCAPSC